MTEHRIQLVRDRFPGRAAFDTAVSNATLRRVAEGSLEETLRLYRPDPMVAFGRTDLRAPGFPEAVRRARARGFEAIVRLAGGRAAVFHQGTLALAWAIPDPDARRRIGPRFEEIAGILQRGLRALGVDARVGEVPGEYCPGRYSVNARSRRKLAGVGQRVVRGAAHVGAVVVVEDHERVRSVLDPVYRALDLSWRPETAGSLRGEVADLGLAEVEQALLDSFAERYTLVKGTTGPRTLERAATLEPEHRVQGGSPSPASPSAGALL